MRRYLLIVLLFMSHVTLAAPEIYKWVDEEGRVHYGDKPKHKNAKEFEYDASVLSKEKSTTPGSEAERNEKRKRLLESYDAERSEKKRSAAENKKEKEKRKRYCKEAKMDLRMTQDANLLYNYDEDGNRYFYDEAQRKAAIAEKKKIVKKWCG